MTLVKIFSVFCDHEGCPRWIGESADASETRRYARSRGWKRVPARGDAPGRDLCPEHKEE